MKTRLFEVTYRHKTHLEISSVQNVLHLNCGLLGHSFTIHIPAVFCQTITANSFLPQKKSCFNEAKNYINVCVKANYGMLSILLFLPIIQGHESNIFSCHYLVNYQLKQQVLSYEFTDDFSMFYKKAGTICFLSSRSNCFSQPTTSLLCSLRCCASAISIIFFEQLLCLLTITVYSRYRAAFPNATQGYLLSLDSLGKAFMLIEEFQVPYFS